MQRFITCRFLDVANTMLEITDFCPKLRFFSILITDFNFQRLAALANTVVALGEHLVLMLALVLMKREAFTLIEDGCKRTLSI